MQTRRLFSFLAAFALLSSCIDSGSDGSRNYSSVAVFGDSLTSGQPCCGNYAGHLSALLGAPVANHGSGGEPLQSGLGRFNSILDDGHDLIIIMDGTNDAAGGMDYGRSSLVLSQMLANAKSRGIEVAVCSIPPFTGGATSGNPRVLHFNSVLKSTANAARVKFIDVYSAFKNDPSLYQGDGVHLNREGNIRVATAMANAL